MTEAISHNDLGLSPAHPHLPTVVLLPGLDGTIPVRIPFLKALGRQLPFIYFTLPPDRITSFDEAEAYYRERLPRDRPFVLAGYSYTGPVAIRIAADPPPGLAGLALLATFAQINLPLPRWLSLAVARPLIFRFAAPKLIIGFLAGCSDRWVLSELQKAERFGRPRVFAERLQACIKADVREELMRVRVPILNVIAARDSLLPGFGERDISRLRPDARLATIPGGHGILECTPELAADTLADFVAGLSSGFEHNAG